MVSVNTAKFIDERLAVIDKELSGTDEEMAQFKVANKMISPTASAELYFGESYGLTNQQLDKEVQMRMALSLKKHLENKCVCLFEKCFICKTHTS